MNRSVATWAAWLAVAAAVLTLLVRLPATIGDLRSTAKTNDARDARGRLLASADSLDIDNDFVMAALANLPDDATFAVVGPRAPTRTVTPVAWGSLEGYFRYVLLPRREVGLRAARYLLCYECRTAAHPARWMWSKGQLLIGRLPHG